MMTDPIADMLTRIRNASAIERPAADMPATNLKVSIARVLKEEGFILDYQVGHMSDGVGSAKEFVPASDPASAIRQPKAVLRVFLKYGQQGERVIRYIARSSKPGRRYYQGAKDIRRVLDGLGIAVISTPKGVLSDRQARKANVGGEVLCVVW